MCLDLRVSVSNFIDLEVGGAYKALMYVTINSSRSYENSMESMDIFP